MLRALGLLILASALPWPAFAAEWRVDPDRSTIAVTVTQNGRPVEARFERYEARITFDPAAPEAARITVTVDTASFTSGVGQIDEAARSREFLAAQQHPVARYELTGLRPLGGDSYALTADLELRGAVLPVEHAARITAGAQEARATGTIELVRTDWGVGQGQFPTGEQVGLEVVLRFDLTALKVPG